MWPRVASCWRAATGRGRKGRVSYRRTASSSPCSNCWSRFRRLSLTAPWLSAKRTLPSPRILMSFARPSRPASRGPSGAVIASAKKRSRKPPKPLFAAFPSSSQAELVPVSSVGSRPKSVPSSGRLTSASPARLGIPFKLTTCLLSIACRKYLHSNCQRTLARHPSGRVLASKL